MTTISDIAKKAKVAKSTVSLVINNTGYVSEQTKEKVLAAIEELNYVPNSLARNLSLQKSGMVGVMVPDIANPFLINLFGRAKRFCFPRFSKARDLFATFSVARKSRRTKAIHKKNRLKITLYPQPVFSY